MKKIYKGSDLMDMKQLFYFCTIVEEGQITRAANKLHMAQPPLSQQLKHLEEEFDVKLFERNGRKMELTSTGKLLYKRAKHLLSQASDTILEVKEMSKGFKGVLTIGANKSCFSHLASRIRSFRENYPQVSFQLREGDTYQVGELLKEREIELAVVRLPIAGEGFSMIHLPKEPYIFVLPQEWKTRAPTEESITLKQISAFPLLLLHRINGTGQYELVLNEFIKKGLHPNIICECPDPSMILSLVASGVGATIVPQSALQSIKMENLHIMKIKGTPLISESAVIWLENRYLSKSALHLIQSFEHSVNLAALEQDG
ncbi:LysR family transcriptional regulator [Bacillus sp. OV322]|uniref:LysR family transcriptional regulator n=1 Tax=Bacillus sp. OV322 TaxID=1882764 RepID=UPI00210B82FC|nr:LysR family transcriptional regulator [Bacillus sp. OV322]